MCISNRNRPDHRSTAFGLITVASVILAVLLLTSSAAAENTASYDIASNGSEYTANISFTNLDRYYLVSQGLFFGLDGDTELSGIRNLTLINVSSGEIVTPKSAKGLLTFPKGNYTLTYTAPMRNGDFYVKYPQQFNVTITLHDPQTTGHPIIGPVDRAATVTKSGNETTVTHTRIVMESIHIYDKIREPIINVFVGCWVVILLILLLRYQIIKKRRMKVEKEEKHN